MKKNYSDIFIFVDDEGEMDMRYPNTQFVYTAIVSIITQESLNILNPYEGYEEEDNFERAFYDNVKFNPYYTHIIRKFKNILEEDYGYNLGDYNSIAYKFFQRFSNIMDLNIDFESENNSSRKESNSRGLTFSNPTFNAYPVHLDYKIANLFGSFPNVYPPCRLIKPNKDFMKDTKNYFK